jgi:hypothetical protein
MRSTAGIVAGLLVVGLFANCGGSDSDGGGPKAGSSSVGGEGGDGQTTTAGKGSGGTSSTAGKGSTPAGGEGGAPVTPVGCTKNADCGATAKCVGDVCKKNDGVACVATAECQNACIDKVCTSKGADGADCSGDDECAHTCIDNVCAPVSSVGGDCDADNGAGGAGGAGSVSTGTAGAGGESGALPAVNDCKAPLQCYAGKCLTPNGEACTDNVDCLNTCVANVCKPKGSVDGACDDTSDCVANSKLVCDVAKHKCKLDTLAQCQVNDQCQSNRCLCSNHDCTIRECKTMDSICQCRYSPTDAPSCDNSSPTLDQKTIDPNGCSGANFCSAGSCIVNNGGACTEPCTFHPGNPNAMPAVADSCTSAGAPVGCNGGYHGNVTTQCYVVKGTQTCSAACQCDLN